MQTDGLTHGLLGPIFICLKMWQACICIHTAGGEATPFMAFAHFSIAGTMAWAMCVLEGRNKPAALKPTPACNKDQPLP